MSVFVLRLEPCEDSMGHMKEWRSYVVEINGGKEVLPPNGPITGYGYDPLGAVTKLVLTHARILDGYRKAAKK